MPFSYGKIRKLRRRGRLTKAFYVRKWNAETKRESWVTTKCKTIAAAREWVAERERQQAMGSEKRRVLEAGRRTFAVACEAWLQDKDGTTSDAYFRGLSDRARKFWIPFFGKIPLSEIEQHHAREFLRKRKAGAILPPNAKKSKVKPLAVATVNGERRDLKSFFRFCIQNRWLTFNPCDGIPNYRGVMRRKVRVLTAAEEARFVRTCRKGGVVEIEALRNAGGTHGKKTTTKSRYSQAIPAPDYLAPLVVVGLNCGFRMGTMLSLQWKHVNFDSGWWRIPGEIVKTREDYQAPVPRMVIEELKRYRSALSEGHADVKRLSDDARIFGLEGDSRIGKAFTTAAKRAALPDLTPHCMRGIYLNKLRDRGVGLDLAMALTGHKSVATVMKHYREIKKSDL